MGSKIISKKDIDFNKKIEVSNLPSPELVQAHLERIKEIYPDKSDVEINNMLNSVVLRDIAFGTIMDYISTLYEFEFSQQDIDQIKAFPWFQDQVNFVMKSKPNANREETETEMAKQEIRKVLLFDDLCNLLDINFSDEEFEELIERYYEDTNFSIREWKRNPTAREGAKRTLLNEKLVNNLITKFVNLDTTPYFKQLEKLNEFAKEQESLKNSSKPNDDDKN